MLIAMFVAGQQTVDEFVERFLAQWRNDRDRGTPVGATVDNLMTAVDCYSPTPLDAWTIDEDQLRSEAVAALDVLG